VVAAGLTLLTAWGATLTAGELGQSTAVSQWQRLAGIAGSGRLAGEIPPPPGLARPLDGVDFRIRVPRLDYVGVVREGVSDEVLFGGPGHYPDSSWPGEPGTVGVAAHNVYWLRFDQLRPGDAIAVDTRYGTFQYHVTGTRVVSPTDGSVLAPAGGRRLTLTTCWPLWAGQLATRRLAVLAS
jgi:LPXTG-site transpeptidase (sortase) family protein